MSSIEVPSASQQPPGGNRFYLQRSFLQDSFTSPTSVLQAGWATVGSNFSFDNCGTTDSATWSFEETDNSGSYSCTFYDQGTYPEDKTFNVFNASDVNGWKIKESGTYLGGGPFHPGFTEGYGAVGGEAGVINGATAVSATCFGDDYAWGHEDTETTDGSDVTTNVTESNTTADLTGGWSIGSVPSPLCDSVGH